MKKPLVVSVIIAGVLLVWSIFTPAQPQDPANEEKPTFYRLTPGVYVNGYPRFTVHYQKDWVEGRPDAGGLFLARTPGPNLRVEIGLYAMPTHLPVDKFTDFIVPVWRSICKDVTIVSHKPSRLRDGTLAWELELQMVRNGLPYTVLNVTTKKGDMWINTATGSYRGKIGEDLRDILYSLQYEPGKDEPVKVPPDAQEFLDRWCIEHVSHDVVKVMSHYSERYLNSGKKKIEAESFWYVRPRDKKGELDFDFREANFDGVTTFSVGITDFVAMGDKAYLSGLVIVNGLKWALAGTGGTSIIKENGEWKWYGNQRDVSP